MAKKFKGRIGWPSYFAVTEGHWRSLANEDLGSVIHQPTSQKLGMRRGGVDVYKWQRGLIVTISEGISATQCTLVGVECLDWRIPRK